jgi:hypothetical protein
MATIDQSMIVISGETVEDANRAADLMRKVLHKATSDRLTQHCAIHSLVVDELMHVIEGGGGDPEHVIDEFCAGVKSTVLAYANGSEYAAYKARRKNG